MTHNDNTTDDTEQMTKIPCGCGDYSILVSEAAPIYDFGAICPECENHFGWSEDSKTEQA